MVVDNGGCRPVDGWIDLVKDTNSVFHHRLDEIYGDNCDLKREAARMCRRTLEAFADRYAPGRDVIVIRSTGRVNLVGTHIDHRGGSVNPIGVRACYDEGKRAAETLFMDYYRMHKMKPQHLIWSAGCHSHINDR